MDRGFLRCAALLALLLITVGCNTAVESPPGGTAAVAYWHKVLLQYPDLPEKVRAIVEKQRSPDYLQNVPQSEVRIYGADEVVSIHGRHVDVVITDLDDDTLRKLLAWWEQVPRLAKELGVDYPLPFSLPESTRHAVVLGREGRIAVSGPGDNEIQSIQILSDEVAGRTTIGVHAFGPDGDSAVEHLAQQARQVRGPPSSEVRAGRIALPPPEENVTVLVIGRLANLDIAGPTDDAQQDITFAAYLNQHLDIEGNVAGVLAGTPFAATEPEYVAAREESVLEPALHPVAEVAEPVSSPSADWNGTAPGSVTVPTPITPINLPANHFEYRPLPIPQQEFRPIHVPPYIPPPITRPIVVPRFGS